MAEALASIKQSDHPDLLVGFNKADDAGVYRIGPDLALVQSLDFFPPIVYDPYQFGQITAANSVSDIYAMGGKPLTALNIVCFPMDKFPPETLTQIIDGAQSKLKEANVTVGGGHSIKDKEIKFGLSITGLVNPDKMLTNSGAKAGDKLFLTKPLGTGIITTAIKQNKADEALTKLVIETMSSLNKTACELMLKHNAHSVTDITGFGLLGHTYEMAAGSEVTIRIFSDKVPLLPKAKELAGEGILTGGAKANREYLEGKVSIPDKLDSNLEHILFDPQTSGGLLISVGAGSAEALGNALKEAGLCHEIIGEVIASEDSAVVIL